MKRNEELTILNSFWLWSDDLITLETMMRVLDKLKEKYISSNKEDILND